jgi:hypothetical protein
MIWASSGPGRSGIGVALVVSVTGRPGGRSYRNAEFESGTGTMAQRSVQHIIGQILTDEELRDEFLERPHATLAVLGERGFELTDGEVDALVQTDRRLWRSGEKWIDPRLQRCRLTRGRTD